MGLVIKGCYNRNKTARAQSRSGAPANTGLKNRLASGTSIGGGSAGSIAYSNPSFYTPIHTAQNWQIPSKRQEVYIWARFFSQSDPTIAASLRFYSQVPFQGFENIISDDRRKEHFDNVKKRLQLEMLAPLIAYEFFSLGDAFPFVSLYCPRCGGFGVDKAGNPCDHSGGGQISYVTLLNPDWVDVQINPLVPNEPLIRMIPDDTLKQIVWSKKPPEIFERIPLNMRKLILSNQPIPLSMRSVTHMKHDPIPYQAYGRSLLAPLFRTLAYQDKLRQAQWIVADRHILPIKVCKIGSDTKPASQQDIADTQAQLAACANDPNMTIITHHCFDFEWIGAAGKILQLTKEYELIDAELIKGLGVNEAILSGQGPSYGQAAIGIEATIKRIKTVQNIMAHWICEKIYKTEAQMRGFYRKDKSGNPVLDYPTIRWDDLNLRDEAQKQQTLLQLWDKGIVSTQLICEKFDIDYEMETERVRIEKQYQQQMGIVQEGNGPGGGKGGMGGGFGGGGGGGLGGGKGKAGLGNNTPGGGGAPGLPGDSLAPSMSGGGSPQGALPPSGGGTPAMASYETQLENRGMAEKYMPKIHRPKKYRLHDPKEPKQPEPGSVEELEEPEIYVGPRDGSVRLNDLEMRLCLLVEKGQKAGNLPANFVWQEKPEPERMSRVVVDGIFPDYKLIIEADGKRFHALEEDIQKDQNRDYLLGRYGWKVLRFKEDEINHQGEQVLATIIRTIREIEEGSGAEETQASSANMTVTAEQDLVGGVYWNPAPGENGHGSLVMAERIDASQDAEKEIIEPSQEYDDLSELIPQRKPAKN